MPTTTDRCTCPPLGAYEGPYQGDRACPVLGSADAIMTLGEYVDRRWRIWRRNRVGVWSHMKDFHPTYRPVYDRIGDAQMRLLIRRDRHRAVCPGLRECQNHPVPYVVSYGRSGYFTAHSECMDGSTFRDTLPEAFAAALQFALDRGSEHPSGTGPE